MASKSIKFSTEILRGILKAYHGGPLVERLEP
jgi:hypothetical protein